jgi:beta-lactamase superfamily II metal-dependent hydrolase
MRLTIFQSDKGDCLLVESADGRRVLVDGGMRSSYSRHVAPALGEIARDGGSLDAVYVSHIDQDHISGVLQLMDDVVAWRVHDYQVESGNDAHPEPDTPRPPEIRAIWHNAFHEQVGANAGAISDMLAARSVVLSGGTTARLRGLAARDRELATSTGEAIQLSRRVGASQLGIPLNPDYDGRLMYVRDDFAPIELGSLRLTVIGPFEEDLKRLRTEWNKWLKKNGAQLEQIRDRARRDEDRLRASDVDRVIGPASALAEELGRRENVTVPNLASLMLLVEEGDRTVLLTGDGHADDILAGLDTAGRLDGDGRIHVDVLKVAHHGSEHNTHAEFCRRVSADDYVFCGNGAHENPDLRVVELIATKRLEEGPAGRFRFWFNCSSSVEGQLAHQHHMRDVERLVAKLENGSGGRMRSTFMRGSTRTLAV